MSPEAAARWTALVERCRPVLDSEGMEAVQALLVEEGVSILMAITITRTLLGLAETPLRDAVQIVESSAARAARKAELAD